MKENYLKLITKIERLHRLFLEVLRAELVRMNVRDINNVQCLILYNVGRNQTTIGELISRGNYLGSNVTYNSQKLIHNGYLIQKINPNDRRSTRVELSPKGIKLYDKLHKMFAMQTEALERHKINNDQTIEDLGESCAHLERFWLSLRGTVEHL